MCYDGMFKSVLAAAVLSNLQNWQLVLNQACKRIHKQANMCCVQILRCECACTQSSRVSKQQCPTHYEQWQNHHLGSVQPQTLRKPGLRKQSTTTYRTYPGSFPCCHLLTMRKLVSECCIIERFIGTIAQWSVCYAVRGLRPPGQLPPRTVATHTAANKDIISMFTCQATVCKNETVGSDVIVWFRLHVQKPYTCDRRFDKQ